ncbi:MAG: type IV pilin protein [Gammaproteobacteria bacterium]|nr:type IV pilin protein [Gammaproteobacteria bacterium]
MKHPNQNKGFTLIELMVALAVFAILAAIAYPSYMSQVRKTRRADAQSMLLDASQREMRYYTANNTYTNDMTKLDYSAANNVPTEHGYYLVSVAAANASSFTLQAVPQGDQTNDSCGTLKIDNLGQKTATGGTAADCW